MGRICIKHANGAKCRALRASTLSYEAVGAPKLVLRRHQPSLASLTNMREPATMTLIFCYRRVRLDASRPSIFAPLSDENSNGTASKALCEVLDEMSTLGARDLGGAALSFRFKPAGRKLMALPGARRGDQRTWRLPTPPTAHTNTHAQRANLFAQRCHSPSLAHRFVITPLPAPAGCDATSLAVVSARR